MSTDLKEGDEAFCIVTKARGRGERDELLGAARVRIEKIGAEFACRILEASGPELVVGHRVHVPRSRLYDPRSRAQRQAYQTDVHRFWPARGAR